MTAGPVTAIVIPLSAALIVPYVRGSQQMTSVRVSRELHGFATVLAPFSATSEQVLQYYQQVLLTSPENL